MSSPEDVARVDIGAPLPRDQNVPLDITPNAVESFEHHEGYSFATNLKSRYLSVWGFPWWTADPVSAPVTGGFSTGFSSGFEGGADSPQGAGFDSGFSSGFGS